MLQLLQIFSFTPITAKFDFQVTFGLLSDFYGKSMAIFALTLAFSLPLGLIVCALRRSKIKVISLITKFYISVMRGTPLMLQLVVVWFGPSYIYRFIASFIHSIPPTITIPTSYRFWAVIIGFSINYAAYFAEIYRGGIESISKGQYEAAAVLGMSKLQTFFRIILPQVIKVVLPSITNETITLVKDTSLAFAISYVEMFTTAKQCVTSQSSIMPLFVAGLFYYVTNLVIAILLGRAETKMAYYS